MNNQNYYIKIAIANFFVFILAACSIGLIITIIGIVIK